MTAADQGATPTHSIFLYEIKSMMYSFGDCRHPSSQSASLIEEITHQQMSELILRAAEVTNMRSARFMSVEDVLFLLRKDRDKLKRLIRHLNIKEMAKRVSSQNKPEEEEGTALVEGDVFRQPLTTGYKRRKISFDFLSSIEQPGDSSMFDLDDIDEIQQERLERQDAITKGMDSAQYTEYAECRQANFHKNTTKFKEWLGIGSLIDLKPNQDVIEVFGYLAYESVREIVELSLLVKKDMESGSLDPCANHHLTIAPTNPTQFGTTPTFITTPLSPSSPPPTSPPPLSPTPGASPLANTGSTSGGIRTSRKRKKKPEFVSESPETEGKGIKPLHVREALRRYTNTTGPLTPLATHCSKPSFSRRTLCL